MTTFKEIQLLKRRYEDKFTHAFGAFTVTTVTLMLLPALWALLAIVAILAVFVAVEVIDKKAGTVFSLPDLVADFLGFLAACALFKAPALAVWSVAQNFFIWLYYLF